MANASIGHGSLLLTTDDKATPALAGISATINKFGTQTSNSLKSMFSMDHSKSWLAGIKGGVAGIAAAFAPAAIGEALKGIRELAQEGRQLKSLGIDSAQGMGLEAAFKRVGIEGEGFRHAITRMGKDLNGMEKNGKSGATAMQELGLSMEQIKGKSLDQQFLAVATAISKLPPGQQQVTAAMQVFGREGAKLLPILSQGGDKLQAFIDKAKKMGNALDQKSMDKIMAAQQAIPRIAAMFEGLKNKALVAVAPVVTIIGEKLTKALEFLMPIFDRVSRALSTHWQIIADIFSEVFSAVQEVIDVVAKWVDEIMGSEKEAMKMEDIVVGVWRAIGIAAAYVWDTLKVGAGALAIGVGHLIKKYGDLLESLRDVAEAMQPILKRLGLDSSMEKFDRNVAHIKALGEGMKGWGKGTFDNFGKSADDVRKWFANRGKKDGAEEAGDAFAHAAGEKLKQEWKTIEQGSVEDYKFSIAKDQQTKMDKQAELVRAMLDNKAINIEVKNQLIKILAQLTDSPAIAKMKK